MYGLQSLVPTNPHWVVGYGPFSLCVIHKEGLCPSSGDIIGLMTMNVMGTLVEVGLGKMDGLKDDMKIKGVSMEMTSDRGEWEKKTCCADPT
jgi:hypothetical protein